MNQQYDLSRSGKTNNLTISCTYVMQFETKYDELIEQYTEIVVDSMDMQALIQYAQEQLANYFDKCSDIELEEDIRNYDDNDGLYEELIDNVTNKNVEVV